MIGRIYITLNDYEFDLLRRQAQRELRGVREQATIHILTGLGIVDCESRDFISADQILSHESTTTQTSH